MLCSSYQRNTIDFDKLDELHSNEEKVDITNPRRIDRLGKPNTCPRMYLEIC